MSRPKGYKMSEEQKAAISRGRTGMKFSDEHRANIALARIGTQATEETKTKLGAIHKQRCNEPKWKQEMSERAKAQWSDPSARASLETGQQAHFSTTENGSNFPAVTPQSELDYLPILSRAGYVAGYVIPTNRPECNGGGYYRLDYAHVEAKVDIEIDGSSHKQRAEQDAKRDAFLRGLGWRVIRIKV